MLSFPLLGRSRFWAALCLVSLLNLFALSTPCSAQYPGGGYPGGGYPGGGYPGGGVGYTVQCTDGTINGQALTPTDSPYPGSSGSTSGSASQTAQPSNGQPGTCKITASDGGAITGNIAWNGGSANTPAPPAAIVMETSTATWSGTVGDSPDFVFTPDPTAGLGTGVSLSSSQDQNRNMIYTGVNQ